MADSPEIKVKLTAEDTGVSAAIKELGAQLKNLKKNQDETAASAFNLAGAFKALVAGAVGLGLLRIGQEAFQSATNIGKLSDKTGLSTQTLSVFHKVAEDVGASTENVDKALLKAAKSITEFQQGSTKAAGGFKLLNLTAKDFAGLNADQKLQLVVAKLGAMEKGFQKATATSQIFGKGASDLTLVANSLAAQGFDKATESTAKLGLLLDQTTTDTFREAKAAIQDLTDEGKGMATQFEAGMLPAINDVADALIDSISGKGANGFKQLGETAGTVIRDIVFGIASFGIAVGHAAAEIEEEFDFAFNHAKAAVLSFTASAEASLFEALGLKAQAAQVKALGNQEQAAKDHNARMAAIEKDNAEQQQKLYENIFPSDDEEARRRKERLSRLRPENQTQAPEPALPPDVNDAAAKARLALTSKKDQDEIELLRAKQALASEIDKEAFDKGEITLAEYYSRRRAIITTSTQQEVEILQISLKASQDELARLTTEGNQKGLNDKQKDQNEAAKLTALGKIDELQTKIATTQLKATTDQKKLDDDEFKAKLANNAALLEFEKQIDQSSEKRLEAARVEIELEKQKLAIILEQSGASKAQIDAELARFEQVKTAQAEFKEQQISGAAEFKSLDAAKSTIQDKVKSGQLFSLQAEEQIRQLERERLPVLQQIADQLRTQAEKSGTAEDKATAEEYQAKVDQVKTDVNTTGTSIAQLRAGLESSLVGGFTQFFDTVGRGTESVAQSFKNLAGSIIGSLAKMTAQMLAQIAVAKLLNAVLGGASGGTGSVASVIPHLGFAEGGLIKGPGGPKADAIPARLSAGEFVVKADAVASFGAHNLEAINRGLKVPSFENLALPKFAEGGLVGQATGAGGNGSINLGIELSEGLILKHLSSKQAGRIVLDHITSNPKAASKALGRSQG